MNFSGSIQYIHKILGLRYTGMSYHKKDEDSNKIDILQVFKKALSSHKDYSDEQLKIYNEDICKEFIQMPFIGWVKEGIMPKTQDLFGIGYSRESNRLCIPHRLWYGNTNDYVGVIGRTMVKNYEMFDIPKYFPLQKFPKSMNIYGLQENYKGIQEANQVNIFESEKSTLKRHSRLDYTCVSLGGHDISHEQSKILIGLNVELIIQMDKDISLQHVRGLCEMFYGIRPVYYVFDEFGLLKSKESTADKPSKIYNVLWNRKVRYDESEHLKYIEELKGDMN